MSILMVIAAHSIDSDRYRALYNLFGHLGNLGVRAFFLISGFLITTLLLNEQERTGRISLRAFYLRRMLRIFPAFYVYVSVVLVLAAVGLVTLRPGDVLHTLTYTMNYHSVRAWYLNHTWSLSVEEQFYLLWPLILVVARPRRALCVAVGAIVAAPVVRLGMHYLMAGDPTAMARQFQAVCDALATGCLLAGVYTRLGDHAGYRRLQASPGYVLLPVGLVAAAAASYKLSAPLYYVLGQSLANLGGILLLDYVVRVPSSTLGSVLNTRPLVAIGKWSYSIYLWQELFLDFSTHGLQLHWPLNGLCVAAASLASYYGIEVQFLKLKGRCSGGARE